MKITLISVDQELYCVGVRVLSACLCQAGHHVQCLFLPPKTAGGSRAHKFDIEYSDGLLDQVGALCSGSDLIGLSLMTNQVMQAISVTRHLKNLPVLRPLSGAGFIPQSSRKSASNMRILSAWAREKSKPKGTSASRTRIHSGAPSSTSPNKPRRNSTRPETTKVP